MWTISSDQLPTTSLLDSQDYPSMAPIAFGPVEQPLASSIVIKFANTSNTINLNLNSSGVLTSTTVDGRTLYTVPLGNQNLVNNILTINLQNNDLPLTPAIDIDNIKAGEYYLNPYNNTITIADKNNQFINSNLPVLNVNYEEVKIKSDYIDPALLPRMFWQLPIYGTFSLGYGFESHPNGSLNLKVNKTNLELIREAFMPGNEFTLFGYGLRVSGLNEAPNPESPIFDREYNVSVNIGGKWENYINKLSYLLKRRSSGLNVIFETGTQDCEYNGFNSLTNSTGRLRQTTVNEIASRVNVPLFGSLVPVAIPNDTPYYETVSWASLLEERKRISGYFVDYSKESGIYCKSVKTDKTWFLTDNDLLNYNGISFTSLRWNPLYVPPINLKHKPININNLPGTIQQPVYPLTIKNENTSIIPKSDEFRNVILGGNFTYRTSGSPGSRTSLNNDLSTSGVISPVNNTLFGLNLNDPYFKQSNQFSTEDSQDQQKQQQAPEWRRKPVITTILRQGDKNPFQPPIGTLENLYPREQYHLSLNFDSSGPQKTFVVATSEDGSPISEETYTYGFAFTAAQIGGLNEETGELVTPKSLANTWQLVDYTKVTYLYDPYTGYALGTDTKGWKLSRFSQENDSEPETIYKAYELRELNDFKANSNPTGDELDELESEIEEISGTINACNFRQIPKVSASRYLLRSFKAVYADAAQERSPYETYQVCTPGGKLVTKYVLDPNYVDPMFVAAETSESLTFDFMFNPSYRKMKREHEERNEGRVDEGLAPLSFIPPPPLVTGEETYMRRTIEIIPQITIPKTDSPFDNSGGTFAARDMFVEHIAEFNSLDANFKSSLQNTRFVEHEGRPSIASRKSIIWEKVEPDDSNGNSSSSTSMTQSLGQLQYNLVSPGFENYPENGNISYEKARTFNEALNAAASDHYIQNVLNTLNTSITIPFNLEYQVWDKVSLTVEGTRYNRRITQITHNIEFEGIDERGIPLVKGTTTLSLGLDRDLPFKITQRNIPTPINEQKDNPNEPKPPNDSNVGGFWELGEVLPLSLASRLNLRRG